MPRRVKDASFTSYHTIASRVDDPADFLRRYHRIQATFPVHGPSQPPGRVMYFWAVDRVAGPERGAVVAGYLLMAIGAMSLVPLVVLVGGRCAPGATGAAVLLMACLPSYLLFTPQTDHLILFLSLTAAALAVEGMRYASHRLAPALFFGAGLAAGLGIFVSFTTLAALGAWGLALAGLVAWGHARGAPFPTVRRIAMLAVAGVAGAAVVPAIAAGYGARLARGVPGVHGGRASRAGPRLRAKLVDVGRLESLGLRAVPGAAARARMARSRARGAPRGVDPRNDRVVRSGDAVRDRGRRRGARARPLRPRSWGRPAASGCS